MYLVYFLLFFSSLFANTNWWDANFDQAVSKETLISWWGDQQAPSRVALRHHITQKEYHSILDVGFGLLTDYDGFKQTGMHIDYHGVETSQKFYQRALNLGVPVSLASIEALPFDNLHFDLTYARFVLEHLPSYKRALLELIRVAKHEACVTFFLKPLDRPRDHIHQVNENGYSLYHNSYSRPHIEAFLHKHPRVQTIQWEPLNQQEELLHVYLANKEGTPPPEELPLKEKKELSFVIVTPSYNNSSFVENNLTSVFNQKNQNWRLIYIDDCSVDDTFAKASALVKQQGKESQVTLIKNEKRCGALENLYRAIHSCSDDEIVLTLDGDDWLAGPDVLSTLENIYRDPYIWMTYGNYVCHPQGSLFVCSAPIPRDVLFNNTLRQYRWVASHLRTFYAGLFKKIKLEDLLYQGKCFPMTWDQAMMFPMIEMSLDHSQFVPDILYIYNDSNPINDFKVDWGLTCACEQFIRALPPYAPLEEAPLSASEEPGIDLVAFSFNRPMQLYAFLESLVSYAKNLAHIHVIYRAGDEQYQRAYEEVKETFPQVSFHLQSDRPHEDFKPLVLQHAFDGPSEFIVFAVDDIVLTDHIDFKECAHALDDSGAHGFYLRLAPHVDFCYPLNAPQGNPHLISIGKGMRAWQFETGQGDWRYPNSVDLVVYRKADIESDFRTMNYVHPNSLEGTWAGHAHLKKLGLCYETTKMVNIPLNLVNLSSNRYMHSYTPEELLIKFSEGWKIDIQPLFQIKNKSAHIDYQPNFIQRRH